MSDFKIITQAELLTKSRELRDRVEISLHKLGPGAKSFQQSLNSIVAGLSVQNAHPVDDKQPSLFDSPRVGQPKRTPKRKLTLDEEWQKHKEKATKVSIATKGTQDERDRDLRKFLIGDSSRQSEWAKLQKNGATLAEIRDTWIRLNNISGSSIGPNQTSIHYHGRLCSVWFGGLSKPNRQPDLKGKALFVKIARILAIQIRASGRKDVQTITQKDRKSIDKITTEVNCSKCNSAFPKSEMTRTAGRRLVCKSCAKEVNKSVPKKAVRKHTPKAEFMQPMQATPELQAIVGSKPIPRTDVTKKIWDYIKKNGLQDKANRRTINADEKLMKLFGKKQVSMFEVTKLVSKHLMPVKA